MHRTVAIRSILLILLLFGLSIEVAFLCAVVCVLFTTFLTSLQNIDYFNFRKNLDVDTSDRYIYLQSTLFFLVQSNLPSLLVLVCLDLESLGIYEVHWMLAGIVSFALSGLNSVIYTRLSKIKYEKDHSDVRNVVRGLSKITVTITCMISVPLLIGGDFILEAYGAQFKSTAIVFYILLASNAINALTGICGTYMDMCGMHAVRKNMMLISTIFVIGAGYYGILNFGLVGLAMIILLKSFIVNFFAVGYIYRKDKILTIYWPQTRNV